MLKKPAISVVTATFNRKEILQMAMEKLAEQTIEPNRFELVLVDDGSSDGTQSMVEELTGTLPYSIRFFSQAHKGPGAAHNLGARVAKADIILFLANDMLATPLLIASHLGMHSRNKAPNVAVVGKISESKELPQTAFHKAWDPFNGLNLDTKPVLDEFDFWVSNLSIKRRFFLQNGLFFENSEPAMEDLELAHRLFHKGMKLFYCLEAHSYHYHPQTIDSVISRVYTTGKNFHIYEKKVGHNLCHKFAKILSPQLGPMDFSYIFCRDVLRLSISNGLTVPYFFVPLIRKAEDFPLLEPLVGFLEKRVSGYYFRKGVRESLKRKNQ